MGSDGMDRIVATTPNYLCTSDVLQSYVEKCVTIPIGISKPKISTEIEARIAGWKVMLPKKFFLSVGELRYYKGLHTAIDVVTCTDIILIIVGKGGVDASQRKQAKESNVNNVQFLGALPEDDKWALMNLCYGFVVPSHLRSEAYGISQLEAASVGKPLISCEIGTGTSYVNLNQVTGIVISPSSPVELRTSMERLLYDEALAQKFGQNARVNYHELFTAETQAKRYLDVYEELLAGKDKK